MLLIVLIIELGILISLIVINQPPHYESHNWIPLVYNNQSEFNESGFDYYVGFRFNDSGFYNESELIGYTINENTNFTISDIVIDVWESRKPCCCR